MHVERIEACVDRIARCLPVLGDDTRRIIFVEQLTPLRVAFMHVIKGATGGVRDVASLDYAGLRSRFKYGNEHGAWIVNNGYTRAMAINAVAGGAADMVAFGKLCTSNPDLVNRLRLSPPLAVLNGDTLYGGGAVGYSDYPPLDSARAASATQFHRAEN